MTAWLLLLLAAGLAINLSGAWTRISGGEVIGDVGCTGLSLGPHLYFELVVRGRTIEPAPIFGMAICRK